MCHFVTASLPREAPHVALDALAHKFGRQLLPLTSPVAAQLPAGSAYYLTTLNHCDCGTPLGFAARARACEPDWVGEELKLIRKGWTKAKAARAITQRRESESAGRETKAAQIKALREAWEGFVLATLRSGLTPELGLLLHSYHGRLDEEEFIIQWQEYISPGTDPAGVLPSMEEDVLYVFRSGA
jgi:hypothetical protein